MALRLRIVSDHRRQLGERATMVFEVGGSIGRSADNDWVLPDAQRFISAHHARLHFRDGQYLLEDVSTNGVFVNDDHVPLARRGPHRLRNGDILRMGEYQIVATVEADDLLELPEASPFPTRIEDLRSINRAAQTDLGAPLNLDELLVTDSAPADGVHNAYGQVVATTARAATATAESEPDEEAVARRVERLARAAARSRENKGANLPALYDVQNGLQAFCRGAGLDANQLPAGAETRMLHLAGQILREALVGLKDLERSQREFRNRFRIVLATRADDPRPSLARSTIDEALVAVLSQHESRRLDAVQWLRETTDAVKTHESALTQAMRAAFVDFIGRLDPAELETRFQRAVPRGKGAGSDHARTWELFGEFYRNLTEMPQDHLPHTFVEAFANTYLALMAKGE